ncbi:MAG: 50S ribosomal protein L22 [Flavobacteriales bacterium]|nr:50S ribosomal protein L22 [Flavobacteriales bacterium]
MGSRKHNVAEARKEANKEVAFAKLRNCPTSPRKMRLVADMVRGMNADKALFMLKYSNKEAAQRMEKLLQSAIANWEQKFDAAFDVDSGLYIKEVYVDSARMLKRLQTAPQGRAHRIRKRSNHVTMVLDTRKNTEE